MPDVILFNAASPTVPNRVTRLLRSVQESDWAGKPGALVNPQGLEAVNLVPMWRWKVVGNTVVELNAADDAALAAQSVVDSGAFQTALKTASKSMLQTQNVNRDMMLAVCDVMLSEINALRTNAGLTTRTQNQMVTALKNSYETRIDNWT